MPHTLVGERVWVRRHGGDLVIVHVNPAAGPVEVARHALSTPGRPRIAEEHYPPRPPGPLAREPRAGSAEEAAFLAIGEGARAWLIEAAAAGAPRIRAKMAEAVSLAKLHGPEPVDRALGRASAAGRFADGDLAAILAHGEAVGSPGPGSATASSPGPGPGEPSGERRPPAGGARPPAPPAEDAPRPPVSTATGIPQMLPSKLPTRAGDKIHIGAITPFLVSSMSLRCFRIR